MCPNCVARRHTASHGVTRGRERFSFFGVVKMFGEKKDLVVVARQCFFRFIADWRSGAYSTGLAVPFTRRSPQEEEEEYPQHGPLRRREKKTDLQPELNGVTAKSRTLPWEAGHGTRDLVRDGGEVGDRVAKFFLTQNTKNGVKIYQIAMKLPNVHKIYQMVVRYSKCQ
jgi:hypothetical protein